MAGADFQFIQMSHGMAINSEIFDVDVFHPVVSVPTTDQ